MFLAVEAVTWRLHPLGAWVHSQGSSHEILETQNVTEGRFSHVSPASYSSCGAFSAVLCAAGTIGVSAVAVPQD